MTGFVDRELARIEAALVQVPLAGQRFDRLLVAQQALKWATEPHGFAAPLDMIDNATERTTSDTPAVEEDCSTVRHLDAS